MLTIYTPAFESHRHACLKKLLLEISFYCHFFNLLHIFHDRAKDKQKSLSKDDLMDRNPGSPYIDVEALSDEDSTQSQKLCTDQAEDQRVLTLAEQFLAAMPARIKNDQGEKTFRTF